MTRPPVALRYLLGLLLLVLAYLVSGRLGLMLATPPDYATAVFPAAGIALGVLLVGGWRLWPGVWLGAVFLQTMALPVAGETSSWGVASLIATGATLQALAGQWLVRRFSGYPQPLQRGWAIFLMLLLGGPVSCLLSSSIGVVVLARMDILPVDALLWNWLTWWAGDSLGVLTFMPLVLCLGGKPVEEWHRRRWTVGLPVLASFCLAVMVFLWVDGAERQRIALEFQTETAAYAQVMQAEVSQTIDITEALASHGGVGGGPSRGDFARMYQRNLRSLDSIQALAWVPRVPADQRAAFERAARAEGLASQDPRVVEAMRDYAIRVVPDSPATGLRDEGEHEHYPYLFLEPLASYPNALGLDLAASAERRDTVLAARDRGQTMMSPPLNFRVGDGRSQGVLIVSPVYSGDTVPASLAGRRRDLAGVIVSVVRIDRVVSNALPSLQVRGVGLEILDEAGGTPLHSFFTAHPPVPVTGELRSVVGRPRTEHHIDLGGRTWRLRFEASAQYVLARQGPVPMLTLLAGMLITALVGGVMMFVTGRMFRTEALAGELVLSGAEVSRQAIELSEEVEQRSKTEEALRRSETQLRLLTDSIPALIAYLDSDLHYRFINATYERWCGIPQSEILGMSLPALRAEGYARLRPYVERVLAGERVMFNTRFHDHSRGVDIDVEVSYVPHRQVDGVVVGFFAMGVDTTDRLRAQNNQQLAMIVESSSDAIIGIDADGLITAWNPAAERLYRYTAGEAAGQPLGMLMSEARRKAFETSLAAVRAGQRVDQSEAQHRRSDGHLVEVALSMSPMVDEIGRVTGAALVIRDIAEQKRAQALLVQAILAAPYATLMTDEQGKVQLANREAERLFGYSRDDFVGMQVEELVPEAQRGAHAELRGGYTQSPRGRAMVGRELKARHRDGTEIPVEIGLSPIDRPEGRVFVAALIDTTTRRLAEQALAERSAALERVNAELARSNRDLDDFAYVASHDLKAPLRAVDNLSSWIEKDAAGLLPEKSSRHLQLLRSRVRRMDHLLDDLLQYARAGQPEGAAEEVDLREMVRELRDLLGPPPGFRLDVVGELPSLQAYRVPLRLVLLNLVSNAFKHHDREQGCVEISARDQGSHIEVDVCDDGPGVAPEHHERIFGMFQTLRPRDEVEGSGMGLAIVKRTVESHGGSVRVDSWSGRGACFRFTWRKLAPSRAEEG
ncbi:PAS domain S-box protein [Uliginosibacterium sp. H1]|uniref:PAS domain S-box protein n=1 Tax=Uliginosibacterium sp. H1 TaxID=3114757 RepID=UPI002E197C2E|nr:PAS domain S-box protein [Uliginosibacterium sp. H1]